MAFSDLRKNCKKNFDGFPVIRLAILGDTPTQFLHQSIQGLGYNHKINFEIFEADIDQIDLQVFDPGSELYAFQPAYVFIFQASQKLLSKFYKKENEAQVHFAESHLKHLEHVCETINSQINTRIIVSNYTEIPDMVFGNFANKINHSFIYQTRKLNYELMNLASNVRNLFIADVAALQNMAGRNNIHSPVTYTNTSMVYDLEFWPLMAKAVVDIVVASTGKFHKAIVLDLDNTLWGGIIGDDGIENIQLGELGIGRAFTELQAWLKQLKNRGIILAVCSKNYEHVAKEVFEKHPDMLLLPDDIAVFVANWDNKVDNIRYIQSVLNIGFDSIVYLDDNPFERNMVRTDIPALTIPELPEDPAEYLPYLYSLNLFETTSLSNEDKSRTKKYQEEAKRLTLQHEYKDEAGFLESLEMLSDVKAFDKFQTPRIAQLSQRSNQFNLRTIRYSEEDIASLAADPKYITLYFTLEDKFGDYGLISLVILEKKADELFIDTWLMSCRVLKRGMENFVLNNVMEKAMEAGFSKVVGEYLPTPKNELVKDHYSKLGFKQKDGLWEMPVEEFHETKTFITTKIKQPVA